MVSARASDISHRGVLICNPISSAKLDRVVEYARMTADGTALDVGCGKGELLLRLVVRYGASALGIDTNGTRIAEAESEARRRGVGGRARFRQADASAVRAMEDTFDLTACVGSTHALGGLEQTLVAIVERTVPGGWVVVGEGFWSKPPNPAYLAAIGATADELGRDGWVEQAARVAGLEPVQRWTATREDWDAYEGTLLENMESYVKGTPGDPEGPAMLAERRAFHQAQLRWGRDTMGFAVHLLRKPERRAEFPPGRG